MSPTSSTDPAPERRLSGSGHKHDFHDHSHDHAHGFAGHGTQELSLRQASLLGGSAIGRLGYLSLLLAALWASVFWALH